MTRSVRLSRVVYLLTLLVLPVLYLMLERGRRAR